MPSVVSKKPAEKKAVPKNGQPAVKPAVKKEPVAVVDRPILYPDIEVNGIKIPLERTIITADKAKQLLGWEAEKDYVLRKVAEDPTLKGEAISYGSNYLLKDEAEKEKIQCWNNTRNRPFGESWARQLAQDLLNRRWSGSLTMPDVFTFTYTGTEPYELADGSTLNPGDTCELPEGTVNGETIVISRTGQVESGQHRLIGLVLASQIWAKQPNWKALWPTEPVLESIVVFGVSESPKVLRTIDNVKPRTMTDVFYTSDIFQHLEPSERKDCSRMLDKAVDLLWNRTGAGHPQGQDGKYYQTHSESSGFLERHMKLLECIRHVFEENKDRQITLLKLSPGQCAGMMYLMGSSSSDGDLYRLADPAPSEQVLTWDHWEKAQEFWVLLGSGSADFAVVRQAIGALVDPETGTGGRSIEKSGVLAKAWTTFVQGHAITEEDVKLECKDDVDGIRQLIEWPDFGGIDLGDPHGKVDAEPEPTAEQVEEAKAEERRKKFEEQKKKVDAARAEKEKKTPPAKPPAKKK